MIYLLVEFEEATIKDANFTIETSGLQFDLNLTESPEIATRKKFDGFLTFYLLFFVNRCFQKQAEFLIFASFNSRTVRKTSHSTRTFKIVCWQVFLNQTGFFRIYPYLTFSFYLFVLSCFKRINQLLFYHLMSSLSYNYIFLRSYSTNKNQNEKMGSRRGEAKRTSDAWRTC